MNLRENIEEGIKSIKANKLRTILTATIVAIGIMSLVGILTAIEGIQASINDNFSNLGANTITIESTGSNRGFREGKEAKNYPPLTYDQLRQFKDRFNAGTVSVNAGVTRTAEVKHGHKKTNPNTRVQGGDENYLIGGGHDIVDGRSFSVNEADKGALVVIIGSEIKNALFEREESPINKEITIFGSKFKIIGLLKAMGGSSGDNSIDRMCLIPTSAARQLATGRQLYYEAAVAVDARVQMEIATGLATGLMRAIRRDPVKQEDSFLVQVNKSLSESLAEIIGALRLGGFVIGFITLLGASIGLMNIMLVSVTERTREIGVRKALGATPLKIRKQFLIESLVICQMGGLGGIVLGILIGNVTSRIIGVGGFVIPWGWIAFGVFVGILVGLISGYLPAYKASKLDPIDSLRFE